MFRPRLSEEMNSYITSLKSKENRVLVIGDLHEPFCLDAYLDHCIKISKKYGCNRFIQIGDLIDNHFSSFHTTDPDGMSGGDELDYAIKRIKRWVDAFPKMTITLGNHDRMILRKAFEGGIPKAWIKSFSEVLNAPGWDFVEEIVIDDVLYIHGEGGTARNRMKRDLMSIVQGHLHTHSYIEFLCGKNFRIFGVQVGTGLNSKSFAAAYAKNFPKSFVSCAVILENGTLPILEPMEL